MIVEENLALIKDNIGQTCRKIGRNPDEIMIIGVTKYVTIERTAEAIDSGIVNLGENRLEGLLAKQAYFNDQVNWHFIGTLQSRKVRDVVDKVEAIHSLDRLSLAREIHKRTQVPMDCFVQVNVSEEKSKHGLHMEEVIPFLKEITDYTNVRVIGLMTMAPHTDNEAVIHDTFRRLRLLRDEIRELALPNAPCAYLSMGMSNDYQIAIEEGATHIRIGSKLVGTSKE